MEGVRRTGRRGGQINGVSSISTARVIECSKCGCEWTVSSQAYIPVGKYICPHCTSREREDGPFRAGQYKTNKALLKKIEDFKNWLRGDGWQIEKTKGIYEVVRATKEGRKPLIVYMRGSNGNERRAVQNRDKGVVRAYKRDREIEAYANDNDAKKLTQEEMMEVVDTRKPHGMFYRIEGGAIIAVDNTTGDAWTEEFRDPQVFMIWIASKMSVEEAQVASSG